MNSLTVVMIALCRRSTKRTSAALGSLAIAASTTLLPAASIMLDKLANLYLPTETDATTA